MNPSAKQIVINFYRKPGVRVAISRETLSRLLQIAFPTLDPILKELESENQLERVRYSPDQWKPTRAFEFTAPPPGVSEKQLQARQRRDQRLAEEDARRAARLERRAAADQEAAARRETARAQKVQEQQIRRQDRIRERHLSEQRAQIEKDRRRREAERMKSNPTNAPAPKFVPLIRMDPFAVLRARALARPSTPSEPSTLRALTPQELMTGRRQRTSSSAYCHTCHSGTPCAHDQKENAPHQNSPAPSAGP